MVELFQWPKRLGPQVVRTLATFMVSVMVTMIPTISMCAAQTILFNYPQTNLNGFVIAEISRPADDCGKVCSERVGCAGYDFSSKGNVCRLFASIASARSDVTSTAGTRVLIPNYTDPTNPPLAMRFEKLKNTDMVGDQLFALSKEAYEASDRNIGSQAIDLAIKRGNQDAKLEMGRWYDPRTFAGDRVNSIDANKAARSYFELYKEKNNQEAGRLLRSLCGESANSGSIYTSSFEGFFNTFYCEAN